MTRTRIDCINSNTKTVSHKEYKAVLLERVRAIDERLNITQDMRSSRIKHIEYGQFNLHYADYNFNSVCMLYSSTGTMMNILQVG